MPDAETDKTYKLQTRKKMSFFYPIIKLGWKLHIQVYNYNKDSVNTKTLYLAYRQGVWDQVATF